MLFGVSGLLLLLLLLYRIYPYIPVYPYAKRICLCMVWRPLVIIYVFGKSDKHYIIVIIIIIIIIMCSVLIK